MQAVVLASLGGTLGCTSDASSGNGMTGVDCKGRVPTYDDVAIFHKCSMCHSSKLSGRARMSAPSDINFDTESAADQLADAAVNVVQSGEMPPRTSGITVTDAEKQALYTWAACMAQ